MDDLDRILAENEDLQPSSGFTSRVMDALEQAPPEPVPFPWIRLLPVALGIVGIVAAFAFALATHTLAPSPAFDVQTWLDHPLAVPVGLLGLSLLGSWAAYVLSMRWVASS